MRQAKANTIPLSVCEEIISLSCLFAFFYFFSASLSAACLYMSPYSHNPVVPLSNILLWGQERGGGCSVEGEGGRSFQKRVCQFGNNNAPHFEVKC